jgi:hypothetical protein
MGSWKSLLAGLTARVLAVSAVVVAGVHVASAQVLTADYQFQNTANSSVGTAPPLTHLGPNTFGPDTVDSVSRTVLRFSQNDGLTLIPTPAVMQNDRYTVVVLFKLQQVNGRRRLLDFQNGTSDTGAYVENGHLSQGDGSDTIAPNAYVQVVYTRDGTVPSQRGYVDGQMVLDGTVQGLDDYRIVGQALRFFRDDFIVANQASAGSVARIRIFDGALSPGQVAALDRLPPSGGGSPPALKVPRQIFALVGSPASFDVPASDPDGDPVSISLMSPPLPGATFLDNGDGTGTYAITADAELAGTSHTLAFRVDDGVDGASTAAVALDIGFPTGENPPRVAAAAGVVAPADANGARAKGRGAPAALTETFVEIADPDGDLAAVRAEATDDLSVSIAPTQSPTHYLLAIRPAPVHRGQMVPVSIAATDLSGRVTTSVVQIFVPPADGVEVTRYEIRWEAPPSGDPFEAPSGVEMFEAGASTPPITGDGGGLLGYAIYASLDPDFVPATANLIALAPPAARNGTVTLVRQAGSVQPWYVKVTARRQLGEGRVSERASSDVPRIPEGVAFKKGKLIIPESGSNLRAGALLEIRTAIDGAGERFPLSPNGKGTKWVVKKSARSTPGGAKLSAVVRVGRAVFLVAINPDGKGSAVYPFTP